MLNFLRNKLFPDFSVNPERDEYHERLQQYGRKMRPLGMSRCKVIKCTLSDNPKLIHYFDPPEEVNLAEALHDHLLELWGNYQLNLEEDKCGCSIVAAGLLTYGELERIDYILEHAPHQRVVLDHGCGFCSILAVQIVASLLPLPKNLEDYSLWIKGSKEIEQVTQWFDRHRSCLSWDTASQKFVLL
jgi:hypothetical protein